MVCRVEASRVIFEYTMATHCMVVWNGEARRGTRVLGLRRVPLLIHPRLTLH
jgi:hypothetical protein